MSLEPKPKILCRKNCTPHMDKAGCLKTHFELLNPALVSSMTSWTSALPSHSSPLSLLSLDLSASVSAASTGLLEAATAAADAATLCGGSKKLKTCLSMPRVGRARGYNRLMMAKIRLMLCLLTAAPSGINSCVPGVCVVLWYGRTNRSTPASLMQG